jgi:hypothetical protein
MREEEDLRAALRTLERHAPDPGKMLLTVRSRARAVAPPGGPRGFGHGAGGAPRSWPGRIAPLAAAAAVAGVVAGSVLLANVIAPTTVRPGGSRPRGMSTAAPLPLTADGLPAYFAEAPLSPHGGTLRIMATATGQTVATVKLPGRVAAIAASNGAFFAATARGRQKSFYEIQLAAGGTGARTAELPIPPVTAPIGFIAASPGGSKLAISTFAPRMPLPYGAEYNIQNLIVASTATGAERRWLTPAQDRQGSMGVMNWLADGKTLAFTWTGAAETSPSTSLRLLDTAAPGNDLLASRPVLRTFNRAGDFSYTISPDGLAVIGIERCLPGCGPGSPGIVQGHRAALGSVIKFSAVTGDATVLYEEPPLPGTSSRRQDSACNDPLWISDSGRTLLLYCFQHRPATTTRKAVTMTYVIVLDNGRITRQLPWLAETVNDGTVFPGIVNVAGGVPPLPYP